MVTDDLLVELEAQDCLDYVHSTHWCFKCGCREWTTIIFDQLTGTQNGNPPDSMLYQARCASCKRYSFLAIPFSPSERWNNHIPIYDSQFTQYVHEVSSTPLRCVEKMW